MHWVYQFNNILVLINFLHFRFKRPGHCLLLLAPFIKFRNVLLRQAVYAHEWGSTLYMYIYVFSCFLWCGEFKVPSVLIQGKLIPEISPVTGAKAWIIVLPILCESISPVFEPSVISVLQKHYSSSITYIILLLLRYVYSETEFL